MWRRIHVKQLEEMLSYTIEDWIEMTTKQRVSQRERLERMGGEFG